MDSKSTETKKKRGRVAVGAGAVGAAAILGSAIIFRREIKRALTKYFMRVDNVLAVIEDDGEMLLGRVGIARSLCENGNTKDAIEILNQIEHGVRDMMRMKSKMKGYQTSVDNVANPE